MSPVHWGRDDRWNSKGERFIESKEPMTWTLKIIPPPSEVQGTEHNSVNTRRTSNSGIFPFSALPAEIRLLIWELTLPQITKPCLFQYQCPRLFEHLYREFDQSHAYDIVNNDYVRGVDLPMPLLLVNQEARSVAQKWCQLHGFQRMRNKTRTLDEMFGAKSRVAHCRRAFDPKVDILYLNQEQWSRENYRIRSSINNIALPVSVLDDLDEDRSAIGSLIIGPAHSELLFICDPQPKWEQPGTYPAWRPDSWWRVRPATGAGTDGVIWAQDRDGRILDVASRLRVPEQITQKMHGLTQEILDWRAIHDYSDSDIEELEGMHSLSLKLMDAIEMMI